jgi:hypothetical protein
VLADVDTASRIAKEVACRRFERRRAGFVTLASVMFSGAGHILRGRPFFGAFLMLVAGSAWSLFVFSSATLPLPVRLGVGELGVVGIVCGVVVWLVASFISLLTVPKKE